MQTPHFVRYLLSAGTALIMAGCGGTRGSTVAPPLVDAGRAPHVRTFHYVDKEQTFRVPAGVTSISVVALGAVGGAQVGYNARGGRVHAIVPVQPGEKLYVYVGGAGALNTGGYNGGGNSGAGFHTLDGYGGGGASDVREGGRDLSNRIIVSGGGGGQGGEDSGGYGVGGKGGGMIGGMGAIGSGDYYSSKCSNDGVRGDSYFGYYAGCGGSGGTQAQGGTGGLGGLGPFCYGTPGNNGTLGQGGTGGGETSSYYSCGGFGGGGGGGYFGAGGGGEASEYTGVYGGGGGGGGSSYVEPRATKFRMWQGWKDGPDDGLVVFSW